MKTHKLKLVNGITHPFRFHTDLPSISIPTCYRSAGQFEGVRKGLLPNLVKIFPFFS